MPGQAQVKNPTGPGAFCWYALATLDTKAAKGFYQELFGWAAKDLPIPPSSFADSYTFFEIKGKQVGGMFAMGPELKKMNVAPHWASYVEVENLDKSLEKAQRLGGSSVTPIMTVAGMGRSVVIKDPTGAVLLLWQGTGGGGELLLDHVHGNRCWTELLTADIEHAAKFYSDLFGWQIQSMQMPHGSYTLFLRGQDQIGGGMNITKEMGAVPPHWLNYFQVDNINRVIEVAKNQKAQVPMGPMTIPEIGQIAVVIDPQGAGIGLVQPPK